MFAVCQMSSCLLSLEKLKHKVFLDKYELGKEIREADCQTLVLLTVRLCNLSVSFAYLFPSR